MATSLSCGDEFYKLALWPVVSHPFIVEAVLARLLKGWKHNLLVGVDRCSSFTEPWHTNNTYFYTSWFLIRVASFNINILLEIN